MLALNLNKRAVKYIEKLPPKHRRQVVLKIRALLLDPEPPDSKKLKNSDFHCVDIGEHRIAYMWSETILYVPIVGKRNDGEVYKRLDRLEG